MPQHPLDYQPRGIKPPSHRTWSAGVGIGVALGALLTLPAVGLALFSAGAGEGDYGFALAFFPLSMCIATYLTGTIALPSIVLAFIQFPIYGAVLGYCATVNRRVLGMAVVLIAIVHLYAFMLCASSSMFS